MTNSDEERFAKLMLEMAEAVSQEVSPFKIEIYFKHLVDLRYEDIERAFNAVIRTRTTASFPKIAEILEAVNGKVEDRAEIAFQSVLHSKNFYASVEFEDGTIGKVIDAMGGYQAICDWQEDEIKWHRKEFVKLYAMYDARGPWPIKKFIGEIEANNSLRGFTDMIPPTIQIEDANQVALPRVKKELKA